MCKYTLRKHVDAFTLENKYFDKLTSMDEIVIYTYLEKCFYQNIPISPDKLEQWALDMGITNEQFHNAITKLTEIDFLLSSVE